MAHLKHAMAPKMLFNVALCVSLVAAESRSAQDLGMNFGIAAGGPQRGSEPSEVMLLFSIGFMMAIFYMAPRLLERESIESI